MDLKKKKVRSDNFDHQNEKLHDQKMTRAVIESFLHLMASNFVIRIHILHFGYEKLDYQVSTINRNCLTNCKKNGPTMAFRPKSAARNSDTFIFRRLFVDFLNTIISSINQSTETKMNLIAEDVVRETIIISKISLNDENALFPRLALHF